MSGVAADTVETLASNNAEVDAVLWDRHWSRANLTFSFPAGAGEYAYGAQNFRTLLPLQVTAVNEVLGQFSAISGLTFAAPAAGAAANLRFARAMATDRNLNGVFDADNPATPANESEAIGTAYGIPPSDTAPSVYNPGEWGDMWFNISPPGGLNDMTNPVKGTYAYHTILHEIGHALGFDHPHGDMTIGNHFGNLPANWDSMEFTVMTYRSYIAAPSVGGYSNTEGHYAQSLMVLDIAAIQHLYGAKFDTANTATTYKWLPTSGNLEINGVAENAATAPAQNVVFRTIWDGGGIDTYEFSEYSTNLSIDLRPGSATDPTAGWIILDTGLGMLQRANLGDGNFARFNIANARLFNGDVRSLIENATGGEGDDTMIGNAAANTLRGGDGLDTLVGDGGDDTLFGGFGPDTLSGNAGNDRLEGGQQADVMFGGAGIDQAQYTFANAGVTVDLEFLITNAGDALGDLFDSVENVRGSAFDDILRGDDGDNVMGGWTGGNDRLLGRGGDDVLAGGEGADQLDGGAGTDFLDGGNGGDTYFVQDSDTMFEAAGAGHDIVQSTVDWVLGGNFEDLILAGTANANGSGNGLANRLTGNSGNNALRGLAAFDTLLGGAGNDTYELADLTFFSAFTGFIYDSVAEAAGAGADTVIVTSIDDPDTVSAIDRYTLGANVENGVVAGTLAFNLTGNTLANSLTGNSNVNVLTGGEAGDTYYLTSLARLNQFALFAYDTVVETGGTGIDSVVVTARDNPDTFFGTDGYTLGATIERGFIAGTLAFNLTGNALANSLGGNSNVNVLAGGEGGDTYYLSSLARSHPLALWNYDTVVETGGAGTDTVVVTAQDNPDTFFGTDGYTLGATIENGIIAGTLAFNLTGNSLANRLQGNAAANTLRGGAGNDVLLGQDGADTQLGQAGNDVLYGGTGNDNLQGGDGNDFLQGDGGNDNLFGGAGLDRFNFDPGNGTDLIYDFTNNQDTLIIDPGFGFANAAAVLAVTIQTGNHARIQLPGADTDIYLINYLAPGSGNTIGNLIDDIVIA